MLNWLNNGLIVVAGSVTAVSVVGAEVEDLVIEQRCGCGGQSTPIRIFSYTEKNQSIDHKVMIKYG